MAEHEEAPGWLLLPFDTNKEILPLAAEIYDTPAQRQAGVDKPTFVAELPKIDHSAILKEPIFGLPGRLSERDPREQSIPQSPQQIAADIRKDHLIAAAKAGTLSTADIQRMTMEEYTIVRGYLLAQVDRAVQGKSWSQVTKGWKGTKFTDITES